MRKKAVYYICSNSAYGHVCKHVWDILEEEGYLQQKLEFTFSGENVWRYIDARGDIFDFVPGAMAVCRDYEHYLSEMNQYFADADISGMITWHEGSNAPPNVLTVHTLGDMSSGVFGTTKPQYMRNLMLSYEKNRRELGLNNYSVTTEATHWSGVVNDKEDPHLLLNYPVPMMDIEVGSDETSWNDIQACRALTRSLFDVFTDDGKRVHNMLCVGGVHFDPNFAEAIFTSWDEDAFGITHILANQWLVSGHYEDESGIIKASACIDSIEGGIEAIAFHDKLKGCYKDLVRKLGEKYNVPIIRHQKLRTPKEIEWK